MDPKYYAAMDNQFYPTPDEVINTMMLDECVVGKRILEPSAGSGNIVRWLKRNGAAEVVAFELDNNLRRIVAQDCRVIGADFLQSTKEDAAGIDYIVMNPPFRNAHEHINHAFEIAPDGCTIVAICNKNTTRDTRGDRKKLHEYIARYGSCYDIDKPFINADRKTHCEISLIKLYKPQSDKNEFAGYLFDDTPDNLGNGKEGLITHDIVRECVQRYITAMKGFETVQRLNEAQNAAALCPDFAAGEDVDVPKIPIRFCASFTTSGHDGEVTYNVYKKELQKYYWRVIFAHLKMDKYMTTQLREQMDEFIGRNCERPFTMRNIYNMLNTIRQTTGQRMQKAITDAFDYICSLSAKNTTAGEKWKTNANYCVNRRFICDYITEHNSMRPGCVDFSLWNSNYCKIIDITKALCFLTGREFEEIGDLRKCTYNNNVKWGDSYEWGFFRCRGYMKGTMHFEFLDEKVWQIFNQTAANGKGWLGQK